MLNVLYLFVIRAQQNRICKYEVLARNVIQLKIQKNNIDDVSHSFSSKKVNCALELQYVPPRVAGLRACPACWRAREGRFALAAVPSQCVEVHSWPRAIVLRPNCR